MCPVSINYGLCLEAETLIDDHLAEEGKHRYIIEDDEFSRFSRLFDYARHVVRLDPAIVLRFGRPLDPFGNEVDDEGESRDRRGRRVDPSLYLVGPSGAPEPDAQRDAEYTRALGAEVARRYRRLTVFLPANLVARALFDRVAAEAGTRDVYRLLRLRDPEPVHVAELGRDVEGLVGRLRAGSEHGRLPERLRAAPAEALVNEALRAFRGYHTRPVAEREGDLVRVRNMKLLYYYQNRTAHLSPEGA